MAAADTVAVCPQHPLSAAGLHYTTDWDVLTNGPVNGYHIAASVLAELGVPTLYCFGNHDYRVSHGLQ